MAAPESLVALELTVLRRIEQVWMREVARPKITEIREAILADRFGEAERLAESINFDTVRDQSALIEQFALGAFMLGQAFMAQGSLEDGDLLSNDRPTPPEVLNGGVQLINNLAVHGARSLRKAAAEVVSIASEGQVRKADEIPGLAAALNKAVANGGQVVMSVGANLTTTRLAAYGGVTQAAAQGRSQFQVNEVLDNLTCPFCRGIHGKVFDVEPEVGRLQTMLSTGDSAELAQAYPFPRQSRAGIQLASQLSDQELQQQFGGTPPWHPHCLLGHTPITSSDRVAGYSRRWYDGDFVIIRTAAGHEISATPNHPVLTSHGWVAAGLLDEGDYVIECRVVEGSVAGLMPEHNDVPATIEQVTDALRSSGHGAPSEVPVASPHFHGDGFGSQVAEIWTDRHLALSTQTPLLQPRLHPALQLVQRATGLGLRQAAELFLGTLRSQRGLVCADHLVLALSGAHAGPLDSLGFARTPQCSGGLQDVLDGGPGTAEVVGELSGRFPGQVALDAVVSVDRKSGGHWVYNLETVSGYYVADHIVVHNCRGILVPVGTVAADEIIGFSSQGVEANLAGRGVREPDPAA